MRTVAASRYVTPLREGGSLPAIVEADDDGLYVLKFRGAGQGAKALVAELVAGEIGRLCGLAVPEIVFIELPADLARTARNVNMLLWHRRLGLIDHGAALYFHHAWTRCDDHAVPLARVAPQHDDSDLPRA